ncbi:DNA-directed RNA polymerase III subunit RPC1 [Zygosaccharomyces bailii ISA1307]|nr:DNA-directed RNA polymerase III subunit RPC1 [Zygosaccharomyces bailii ISA1307]
MREVVSSEAPKKISGLEFSALSAADIVAQSEVEISTRDLFDLENGRTPKAGGALDPRIGVSSSNMECQTCHGNLASCHGHFGHIKLALPVFHVGYFKATIQILQGICKDCSAILLDDHDKKHFLAELRRPGVDNLRRMGILKKVLDQCKKQRRCLACGALNGVVKKAAAGGGSASLKIIHDSFRWVGKKSIPEKEKWIGDWDSVLAHSPELERYVKRCMDDLNPLKTLNLFKQVKPEDCELLGIDSTIKSGRPETYIWRYLPAPPVCIRPSVMMQDSPASNEDDLTVKLTEIVWTSSLIKAGLEKGISINNMMEHWDYLQLAVAMYINSDSVNPAILSGGTGGKVKPIRGFCQRLKGKQGRFRGNLSGKRVDFSGRTVISPDPNLSVDEVAVPDRVAKVLTYPERTTRYNRQKLQQLIINGPNVYPGANYLLKKDEDARRNLRYGDRDKLAKNLRIGDLVERHLEDGDVVLFNRQPSLHRLSILSHFAKIRPWRTFRLNECVCTPYNADFDGDEMNLHVPQTEEARAEAINLMGVKNNLLTPKSGEPIIAATQDFITGSYLISHKDSFFDRYEMTQLLSMMSDGSLHFDIPPPTIMKPCFLWTGKQIFSLLIKPNQQSPVVINLDAKNKVFTPPKSKSLPHEMSRNDGFVLIRGSKILSGVMDKSVLGDGKKHSVFYTILRDYGSQEAANAMNRMAKLCARYLGNRGFSIGISDVTPADELRQKKEQMVESAYAKCDELIDLFSKGKLETQPGCNEEQTLEAKIGGLLSKVREEVGDVCINELDNLNAPLIMATCGSKGSTLNVSQMVAVVGQQIISGSRVPDGFQDRSLPHFPKNSKTPQSKGFVRNSFFSGLSPPEFLYHAISGREGLVDTAVKTAETGYMSRRLMKSLEDLSCLYDNTVRTSSNGIVQFTYGGDGLDPLEMEGNAQPVNFNRTWDHATNITFNNIDKGLLPFQIMQVTNKILCPLENRLIRCDNLGNPVSKEEDDKIEFIDQNDAERQFYNSLRSFIAGKAHTLGRFRKSKGMKELIDEPAKELQVLDLDEKIPQAIRKSVDQIYRITDKTVKEFLKIAMLKYRRAKVEPGTAVGAIGAQSIGEPGTQMTLKTFHFAGVASMNVTLGVPRIKEIINASKVISTPIINAVLVNNNDERAARVVKGRIEKTLLSDVAYYIQDVYRDNLSYLQVRIDLNTIDKLQLELTIEDIAVAITRAPKLKIQTSDVHVVGNDRIAINVFPEGTKAKSISTLAKEPSENEVFYRMQQLRRALPSIVVKGLADISRAVINIRDDGKRELLVEGYGLREVMSTDGVVGHKTVTNHILEVYNVLGIEAARSSIVGEINYTMSNHGMSVDPRHIQLLGDVMTYKGEILGITRFGLSKMRDSVLQLASFEKTTDHLFDAAFYMKKDAVEGVSECIILGQTMAIGTGAFKVVKGTNVSEEELKPKPTLFENLTNEVSVKVN